MTADDLRLRAKNYGRQNRELWPELLPALEHVMFEDEPILGEEVARFEREFAHYVGTASCVGTGTGTDAIALALRALGAGPGTEVVTQANTFLATVTAIQLIGARPVLVDCDQADGSLPAAAAASALGPRTAAVIAVHLYGSLGPVEEIAAICKKNRIAMIEDAAQAHGAANAAGVCAGAFGAAGCFSFHPSKNLGAFGDGGAVTTSDVHVAEKVRVLRHLGKVSKYAIDEVSGNTKLDSIQAAILRVKLKHLDAWNETRRRLADAYREHLTGVGDLLLPPSIEARRHVYHLFVVRSAHRDRLFGFLKERGVGVGMHYPIPPHLQQANRGLGYGLGAFPAAEEHARTGLSLPISHDMSEDGVAAVCEVVKLYFAECST